MPERTGQDQTLVRGMLAGDERAFEEFFGSYFPGLYRFALARLGQDADAAEEVVQAALCKALEKLNTYRGEAALFTWLCTFCRHELSAYGRRHKRALVKSRGFKDASGIRAALDALETAAEEGPEAIARRKELTWLVRAALEQLPPRYGEALEWKYIEELSVKKIAARLKVGPKAAESLLTRARAAFREGFTALCGGPGEVDLDP